MGSSPMSPDDFRAAAEVYRELGPEYSDAVVESFLEKLDTEIAARVDARLASSLHGSRPAKPSKPGGRSSAATRLLPAAVVTGIPLACLMVLMHGSAAVRADWYQWLIGALVLIAVVGAAVAAAARKIGPVRARLAK
jgi:hypothetical protein